MAVAVIGPFAIALLLCPVHHTSYVRHLIEEGGAGLAILCVLISLRIYCMHIYYTIMSVYVVVKLPGFFLNRSIIKRVNDLVCLFSKTDFCRYPEAVTIITVAL